MTNDSEFSALLRRMARSHLGTASAAFDQAADEIDRLRSALRPFANYADTSGKIPDDMKITNGSSMALRQLTMVDCRRAADALKR